MKQIHQVENQTQREKNRVIFNEPKICLLTKNEPWNKYSEASRCSSKPDDIDD